MIQFPPDAPHGPVIAHTDSARTRSLIPGKYDRQGYLSAHIQVLDELLDGRPVWFPTFNYDFLHTQVFDVDGAPSQVGSLNEFARTSHTQWRTSTPVFNFAGTGPAPTPHTNGAVIYPFDGLSLFAQSARDNGIVLWYGAPLSSATILHHAESEAGGPAYRYDKDFQGKVVSGDATTEVILRYHVRPLDRPVEYDWARIVSDAQKHGVIRSLNRDASVYWAPARALVDFWVDQQRRDALYFLDAVSRNWIAPKLEKLGRRFEINDFEGAGS